MNGVDVLTELRAWRDEFARSYGYDLGAMAATLRALDEKAGARIIRGEPRRPAAVRSKGADASNPAPRAAGTTPLSRRRSRKRREISLASKRRLKHILSSLRDPDNADVVRATHGPVR